MSRQPRHLPQIGLHLAQHRLGAAKQESERAVRADDDFSSLVACANFAHVATFTSYASKGARLGARERWSGDAGSLDNVPQVAEQVANESALSFDADKARRKMPGQQDVIVSGLTARIFGVQLGLMPMGDGVEQWD